MSNISALKPGQVVSFKLTTKLLADQYSHAHFGGMVDYNVAIAMDPTVDTNHARVYSTLPPGTPERPQDFPYVLVTLPETNERKAVGVPWIDDATVRVVESTSIRIIVEDAGGSDIQTITNAIIARGYKVKSVEVL